MASALLIVPALLLASNNGDDEKRKLASILPTSHIVTRNNTLLANNNTLCEDPTKLRVGLRETRRATIMTRASQKWAVNTATSTTETTTPSSATTSSATKAGMTNFEILAKLEEKQELEMVRMAKVLHDLHELATDMASTTPAPTTITITAPQIETQPGRVQRMRRFFAQPFRRTTSNNTKRDTIAANNIAATDLGTDNDSIQSFTTGSASNMSLRGIDLFKLSPQRTQALIQGLLSGRQFDQESLLLLLEACENQLKQDETLIDLRGVADNVAVVGDLHGSLQSLSNVLRLIGYDIGDDAGEISTKTNNKKSYATASIAQRQAVVFNGDFVDRGSNSIEVICTLLLLKLAQPHQVFLLRGNHEDTLVASAYGFQDEVRSKYGADDMPALWGALCGVFSALPICVRTECAAILHGGIPSDNFSLADVQAISTEARCLVKTTVESKDDVTRLLEGILWSDPSPRPGIHPNTTRGCGVFFGPEIARDFLERHDLLYLIRGHEVAETGTKILDCGGGRAVLTVFSSAAYPDGEGFNLGAVIHVDKEGGCHSTEFSVEECVHDNVVKDPYGGALRNLITASKRQLEQAFRAKSIASADNMDGVVTSEQWATVMSQTLELPDIPWMALQPFLAPTMEIDGDRIRWREFLDTHAASLSTEGNKRAPSDGGVQGARDGVAMEILYANHSMLVTVFKFFDMDGDGMISLQEFITGIHLLNKRLPAEKQIKDPEELFHALDLQGTGSIELEEFTEVFRVL
jgi:diadenosine tetraphosphatase ApaH/serine/threonine PP2A family protein phosphatase